MTDFVNLKIKSVQSFRGDYKGRVCVRVLIGMSAHTCMIICICTVFLKEDLHRAMETGRVTSSVQTSTRRTRVSTRVTLAVARIRGSTAVGMEDGGDQVAGHRCITQALLLSVAGVLNDRRLKVP
jgi:hypothetical protein